MYIKWTVRAISGQRGNWSSDQTVPGMKSHGCTLLESYWVDGTTRKRNLAALGYFTTVDDRMTGDAADTFWNHALDIIDALHLNTDDQQKLEAKIGEVLRKHAEDEA